ncbi:F-box protein SNE-like protein [Carex littledalei]|uniref:F-box protein SNE-like protein n=1 Tax=Carex littledalei TaxID=544730 RepID=A0A833VQA5_9POAL|nr:F-box protein SNE-like protein [Carex littledalei]
MGAEQEQHEQEQDDDTMNRGYNLNDNVDILAEILTRLDGRSLGVAACVCRLWSTVCNRDTVWEALCDRHVVGGAGDPGTRSVVAALGGYRRLYRLCLGPALDRLTCSGDPADPDKQGWAHLSLSLSLSLFSIDCYERLEGRQRPASLLFLCSKPVNVV